MQKEMQKQQVAQCVSYRRFNGECVCLIAKLRNYYAILRRKSILFSYNQQQYFQQS